MIYLSSAADAHFKSSTRQAPLIAEVGEPGEEFEGIGRGVLNIECMPVVRDAVGGIGTPTSDHERTKMDIGTTHILVIINGYSGSEGLHEAATMTTELLTRYASAVNCQSWMFE